MSHRHRSRLGALVLAVGLSAACASMGERSIAEVQANPGRFTDRTVIVTGVVTTAWGLPLVPYKLYRVSDGNAEILVLSDNQRTPTRGTRVRVRGEVEDMAVFGGRSVGLHLRERHLRIL